MRRFLLSFGIVFSCAGAAHADDLPWYHFSPYQMTCVKGGADGSEYSSPGALIDYRLDWVPNGYVSITTIRDAAGVWLGFEVEYDDMPSPTSPIKIFFLNSMDECNSFLAKVKAVGDAIW